MTDFTSKKVISYDANQYNSTELDVGCQIDNNLVFPILPNSSDFTVGVNKARIDLSTVPLTRSNIPLKFYQLGLKNGTTEHTAYVRQVDGNLNNYVYNISDTFQITKTQYDSAGALTQITSIDVSAYFGSVGFFAVDAFENSYVVGSLTPSSLVYNLFYVFDTNGTVIHNQSYNAVQAMTLARDQRLFIADEADTASQILVYQNQNGLGTVAFTLDQTITRDFNGALLRAIQTVSVDLQIVVGSEANTITLYNSATYSPITTYNEATITQLSSQSAVLSKFDRFMLTSNEVENDFFYGVQPATTLMKNMETDVDFGANPQGQWLETAKMSIVTREGVTLAYGIGIDNHTYTLPYDLATGVLGTASPVNAVNYETCVGAQNNSRIFSNNGAILVGMDMANLNNYNYYQIDGTTFDIGGNPILSWDVQNSTNKITAVGTNNLLYQTSIPIYPKNMVLSAGTNVTQYGVGWNNADASAISALATIDSFSFGTWTPYGFYKTGDKAYQLEALGNAIRVQELQFPTLAVLNTNLIPEANVDFTAGQIPSLCQIPGGYYAVSNGSLTAVQQIFTYSEAGIIQAGISCATVNTTGFFMSCVENAGNRYLIVGAGDLYVFDVTLPNVPSLVLNTTLTPMGYFPQFVKGVAWVDDGVILPYLVTLSSDSAGETVDFNLFKVEFTNNTFSVIGATAFMNIGAYANNTNGLSVLISCGEVFVLRIDQTVEIWNLGLLQQTSTIQPDVAGVSNLIHVFPDISHTYTWIAQTQVASAELLAGVAISWTNPNEIYIVNTAGVAYSGALVNGSYSLSVFANIPTAYASINVVPGASTGYNSKALNFGIANQNPHGVYNTVVEITGCSGNDVSGEFLVQAGTNLISFPTVDITTENFLVPFAIGNLIWSANGEDIFAGNRDIFTTQTFIDAVNVAFLEAYDKFPANTFAEAPVMTLDYTTGLLTLTYSGDYTTVGNGILFNDVLLQLCRFPSVVDTINPALNLLLLKPQSTSTSQTSKSIYLFNKLTDIQFISNTIFVVDSYFGNNNTNQVITSVQVPITDSIDNLGVVLFYQPDFLRTYNMASNNPLQRLQLQINYVYVDGTSYPLLLAPFTNWQCDLKFIRKF